MVFAMLGVTIYGAMQGYYAKFDDQHPFTVQGQTMHLGSLIMDGKWTGMMFAGLGISTVWPMLFMVLLAYFSVGITWACCLLGPFLWIALGGLLVERTVTT